MYFHLIGIKEKNGEQKQLDFLITGGDIDFVREFLSRWGVVIVSIEDYKEEASAFGRIFLTTTYKKEEIKILVSEEDISERLHFFLFIGLQVENINFSDAPLSKEQIQNLIEKTEAEINEKNIQIKEENEAAILKENKKYEESGIEKCLEGLNNTIIRLEQIKKAGVGIISGSDMKNLEVYADNIKKIRLGTNFNKMASLLIEVQEFSRKLEDNIFNALGDNKFLIDRNSYVTNIDVINESFNLDTVVDKSNFSGIVSGIRLNTNECLYGGGGKFTIYSKFFIKDIIGTFRDSEISELYKISMNIFEYFVAIFLVSFTLIWLIGPHVFNGEFSIYYLPTFGWLGLILYIFNSFNLKTIQSQISITIGLSIVYRYGLYLLKGTFAL